MVSQAQLISKGYPSLISGLVPILLEMVWVPLTELHTVGLSKAGGWTKDESFTFQKGASEYHHLSIIETMKRLQQCLEHIKNDGCSSYHCQEDFFGLSLEQQDDMVLKGIKPIQILKSSYKLLKNLEFKQIFERRTHIYMMYMYIC